MNIKEILETILDGKTIVIRISIEDNGKPSLEPPKKEESVKEKKAEKEATKKPTKKELQEKEFQDYAKVATDLGQICDFQKAFEVIIHMGKIAKGADQKNQLKQLEYDVKVLQRKAEAGMNDEPETTQPSENVTIPATGESVSVSDGEEEIDPDKTFNAPVSEEDDDF